MQCRVLLFALLLLAVTASRAETLVVNSSFAKSNVGFNGDMIDLRMARYSLESSLHVQLSALFVVGDGLVIKGSDVDVIAKPKVFSLSMTDVYVDDATVTIDGYIPTNTSITITNVTAKMHNTKTLFSLSSLHLRSASAVTVQGVTAVWPTATKDAWVGRFIAHGERATILRDSGVFFMQVAIQNAAGVLTFETETGVVVYDNSAVTVDYALCTKCTDAVVAVATNVMLNDSVLRISKSVSDTRPLLRLAALLKVSYYSMLLISESNVTHGSLFDFHAGHINATKQGNIGFTFLNAQSSGMPDGKAVSYEPLCIWYGRACTIAGKLLTNTAEYKASKLFVRFSVSADGFRESTKSCAYYWCMIRHFWGNATKEGACICKCLNGFSPPACIVASDPVDSFTPSGSGTNVCNVPNCRTCGETVSQCTACADGYDLQDGLFCVRRLPPATTTQLPTSAPGPQPLPPQSCSPHCVECRTACYGCSTPVCHECAPGYVSQGDVDCVKQSSNSQMITALPTIGMLLLGAAMGYAV